MATSVTDRTGTFQPEGIKAPCKVSHTGNLTLTGEQTIGSTAVVAGDRVLARSQTDTKENGIWNVQVGAWTRASDMDAGNDVLSGMLVSDAANSAIYMMTFTGEYTAGTTAVTVAEKFADSLAGYFLLDDGDPRTITGGGAITFNADVTFNNDVTMGANADITVADTGYVWTNLLYIGGTTIGVDNGFITKSGSGDMTIGSRDVLNIQASANDINFITAGNVDMTACASLFMPTNTNANIKALTANAGRLAYSTTDAEFLYANGSIWLKTSDGTAA